MFLEIRLDIMSIYLLSKVGIKLVFESDRVVMTRSWLFWVTVVVLMVLMYKC